MNSTWNNNITLFKQRFPQLFNILKPQIDTFSIDTLVNKNSLIIEESKNGEITLKEHNLYLHSRYNPSREGEQSISEFDANKKDTAIYMGFGLGYSPIAFSRKYIDKTLILIEPDTERFLLALFYTDWTDIFKLNRLILLINATSDEASTFIRQYKEENTKIFIQASQISHNSNYFDALVKKINQQNKADEVNTNTLEKFSYLWMKNSLYNLKYIETLQGIERYKGKGKDLPFIILAAGPSLQKILPYLNEIKKRAIIICVDTALHACLRQGVEPDFIILADPQYYCALHLEFLSSPSSILITENAAWPSVFRFDCKEIILFSSLFPIGQYFEEKLGKKGKLGAGGSVTTTAWDFARITGTKEIYMAGMDLGFPYKQTHIRGSQFEEKSIYLSNRLNTTENFNINSLVTANPQIVKDYNGNDLLSDQRMTVFSWWFTQNCQLANNQGQFTYTLTPESCKIDNINPVFIEDFIKKPELKQERLTFLQSQSTQIAQSESYDKILQDFTQSLALIKQNSKKGLNLCQKAMADRTKAPEVFDKLKQIDYEILQSSSKDAASLIFPTQRQLEKLLQESPEDKLLKNLYYSKTIYDQLIKAVDSYMKILKKIQKD